MSIYKGLLFLDGFRIPAEYVEDAANARPAATQPAMPRTERPAATAAPGWRRAVRNVATFAGVVPPASRCG